MPAALLSSVIRAVLTNDGALPEQITTDTADLLIDDSADILVALQIHPGDNGSLDNWPVIAEIVDAAPLPAPYEPDPYSGWDRWGRQ